MIRTKISQEITKQVVIHRLGYLTKQLATPEEAFILGRQYGRRISQIRFESLMIEIQLTHQQLSIIQRNEYGR